MAILVNRLYKSNLLSPGTTTNIIAPIRVSALAQGLEVSGDSNDPPTSVDQTTIIPVRVNGTRKYGITARHIVIARIAGSSPNQYRIYRRVPIFDPNVFISFISDVASTVTYESLSDWSIVGAAGERYHLTQIPPA